MVGNGHENKNTCWLVTVASIVCEPAMLKPRIFRLAASAVILASFCTLLGCAVGRSAQHPRIGLSFEDGTSCGHYRSLLIFNDGRIDYKVNHLPEYSKTLQIAPADVAALVKLVKTFPVQRSSFGDHEVINRGADADLQQLKDELTKVAHIPWDDLSAVKTVCAASPRVLPTGSIWLRDDR